MTSASEEFIAQYITEQNPDIDLAQNTPFYDLFVRFPSVTYLNQVLALRDQAVAARSLGNTAVSEAEYDQLLSNWFFERISASNTYVTGRFIFSQRVTFQINENSVFVINGINFIPLYNRFITENLFLQLDSETEQYYIDLELISQATGIATSVAESSEITPPFASNESFIAGSVLAVTATGDDPETNSEALTRLRNELGTRTTVNIRGLAAYLSELFPGVVIDSYVAGFAEPEQLRDRVLVGIPKRVVRLYFKQKININVPAGTTFYYNDEPGIIYKLKEQLFAQTNDARWTAHGIYWFIEAEIILDSLYNFEGFKEDKNITSSFMTSNYPLSYVAGLTKTNFNGETEIRVGGRTDLYLKVPIERRLVEFYVPPDSGGFIPIPESMKPMIRLHSVSKQEGLLVTPLDIYDLSVGAPELRYTPFDTTEIFVDPGAIGINVIVDASYAPFVRLIHSALQDPLERIISEDVMGRYMNPIYTQVYMIVDGDQTLRDSMATSITTYINNIPAGGDLIRSDMLARLKADVPQVTAMYLDTVNILAIQYMPDGTNITLEDGDVIKPVEDLTLGVSANNSTFVTEQVEIVFRS